MMKKCTLTQVPCRKAIAEVVKANKNKKSFFVRLSAAFFFSSYSKRTGAGFVIYPLSRQLHRGGRTPADKLQYRESRLRLSVLFLPYPGSPPGFPVFILPLSFPRLWRPLSSAAAYSFYKQFFSTYYYIQILLSQKCHGRPYRFCHPAVPFLSPPN